MNVDIAAIPQKVLNKIPQPMIERMKRYEKFGRVETYVRYLPSGEPSPIQPNRIDPLAEGITREILETLPEEDKMLRFQQWCYYYVYKLGMMARYAVDELLENEEFCWLFGEIGIATKHDAKGYFAPKKMHIGRHRLIAHAKKYDTWLTDHSESGPADIRQEQAWMLERMIKVLEAKAETEGIESISVSDMIALMKRQAALHGLDSPKRTETTRTTVALTGDDFAAAFLEVQQFENELEAGFIIEGEEVESDG